MMHRSLKKISVWMSSPSKTVGGAALLIALAGLASRLLGFFRDRILASEFGAGDILDSYYAAFRVPDLLYSLIVLGALSAAFIPVFTTFLVEEKKEDAFKLTSHILYLLLVFLGGLSLLGIMFAGTITHLLVPGFSPEKITLTTSLTRVMLLSPLFLSVSAIFGGVLVSFKQFVAYSLAPIVYNIGIICGALFLAPWIGPLGLAWGVVVGSFFHMLIQYPSLRKTGFHFSADIKHVLADASVRQVIRLMIPRTLGLAVSQVSLFAVAFFASLLSAGSLAVFTLANNIQSVPLGLFGIAFSVAIFPAISSLAAKKKDNDFFEILAETSRRILFFVLPLSLFMIIFRAQLVRVILGAGSFDWEDTILTFEVLKFLSISLFAQSLIPLFARAFFALQDTKSPFYIALFSTALQIALIPLLLPIYGVQGLAIAFSASSICNLLLLYWLLRKRVSSWNDHIFFFPLMKIFFAAFGASMIAQVSKYVFALTISELDTFWKVLFQLSTGFLIGGVAFLVICHYFDVDELKMVKRFILCKILRRPETATLAEDHPERGDW
ncbi:MAG: murein biosynthesis integral membrane protein MurJ [Candidatus Moranbacteria bacterium]|nr:murein biosynthesis integral membrane protein MurJ [Candidatus Moranbacteria bacterium]OIQ01993.1 MAG: murein biosynthesis integral membrane protein MurJ [Candidatus Moranbacteria bacterium CG2_30_41_165]PIP25634.1 MAG: murein biosynthesis integral membrane protein MurJ [Candidatus Moranbacteria bacterium CG23_combo_of_CG06-09_8_20_14_all_41_28]PIV86384.1 MAG: murein biosynthesis integral membrane protein MurJ [Candidatus Moranbacteria bacterium CG17_big_fil_post_rev_8_21_14_2_50_41_107]PIX9